MEPNQPVTQSTMPPTPTIVAQPKPSKLLTILLTLVSLLSLSGLIYFYFQTRSLKQQLANQPTLNYPPILPPQTSPNTASSLNLKTYSNEQYGFSFQYPATWILETGIPNSGLISLQTPANKRFFVTYHPSYSIQEWLDETQSGTIVGKKQIKDYTFTILKGGLQLESMEYLLEDRGKGFVRFAIEPNTNTSETEELFIQTLSTFQFIAQ